jgi:uncharacterized protein
MNMFRKILAAFAAMFAASALMVAHAADPAIEQAKALGIVGELYTGYLAVVDPAKASADIKRRVEEINSGRLQEYTRVANSNGQTVQTVGMLAAQKQFDRAQPGELVKPSASEPWTKKQ